VTTHKTYSTDKDSVRAALDKFLQGDKPTWDIFSCTSVGLLGPIERPHVSDMVEDVKNMFMKKNDSRPVQLMRILHECFCGSTHHKCNECVAQAEN
jgi:hypothetical protein